MFVFLPAPFAIAWHRLFNSLWPSDVIWWQGSWSILAQVMACCVMPPKHYLNQYWLVISKLRWRSSDSISQEIPQSSITNVSLKITFLNFHSELFGANELNWLKGGQIRLHSLRNDDTYMYMSQWTGSSFVQLMASCLFDAKSLSESAMIYQVTPDTQGN